MRTRVPRPRRGPAGGGGATRGEELPRRNSPLLRERAQPPLELLRRPVGVLERRETRLERRRVAGWILRDLLLCLLVHDDVLRVQPGGHLARDRKSVV